jgi:hypothetical protein
MCRRNFLSFSQGNVSDIKLKFSFFLTWLYLKLFWPLSRQQPFSISQSSCVSPVELTAGTGGGGGGGGAKSNGCLRGSLALYKSFHTLCSNHSAESHPRKQPAPPSALTPPPTVPASISKYIHRARY